MKSIKGTTGAASKAYKANETTSSYSHSPSTDALPGTWYIPVVGVHSTLQLFNALFLPRTTFLQDITGVRVDPAQLSSLDRPQHPFLEPLTLNPSTTIVYLCLGAAVLQTWWAGYLRKWWLRNVIDDSDNERRLQKSEINSQKIKASLDAWLATIAGSIVFHIVLVLFGAPFWWHVSRTYTLALLVSILTIYTPAFVYGPPTSGSGTASLLKRLLWTRLFAEFTIRSPVERAIVYPVVGCLVGAWLGAMPIALDWDRPWQAWPLTPAYGSIIGYVFGSLISLTVNAVKQFFLDQTKLRVGKKQP